MSEFFAMGGYAVYVWPSFLLAAIILIANIVAPLLQRKRVLTEIARKLRRARKEQS
ncbi:MAG: heme exporter protein CcmD [Candidatus Thiodiazotropha sp.]|jgi:heme exporter protein D